MYVCEIKGAGRSSLASFLWGLTGLRVGYDEGKGGEEHQEDEVDPQVAEVAGTAIGAPLVLQKADY